jgi:ATP-dependent helicase/nuclease subunit A
MNARTIPDAVLAVQHRASDPAASAWVSANAGSGKTYVLAQRVIRLLLDGTDPAKILCLTYTKAAAANMANRVFERLAGWATLDDTALTQEIRGIGVQRIDAEHFANARKLFAQALETPGGLKVQTIHAFCTRLLQQFPFEADVAARFQVLDDTQQKQMLQAIRLDILLAASARPDSPEGRALATIITLTSDFAFQIALTEAIQQRDKIAEWLEHSGGIDAALAQLSQSLGIAADDSNQRIDRVLFDESLIPQSERPALIAILAQGSKTDREQAERLERLHTTADAERLAALLAVFCTADGTPKVSIVTKRLRDAHPVLCGYFLAEQERVCRLLERRRAVVTRDRTAALLTLANAVIQRYRSEKESRGLLDYNDLVTKTRALLTNVSAAWVHYKLDLGIDHLLIDEAQDTSPEQWDIIERLVAEFATGAGARGTLSRSIFAVGDAKQSIFSFQGADPRAFDDKQRSFRRTFQAAALDWRDMRLAYSFRSNDSVLSAVEQVFADETVFRSVTTDQDGISAHLALPDAAPGQVEIWPLIEPEKRKDVQPWDAPFDKTSEISTRVKLAIQIAKTVRQWIDRKVPVGTGVERRPVRPGDILVLVRQRGPLFEMIIRALKNENVDVAGADRLVLTEHIAVMDLLALADALLLPDDDLALATVLKSPIFGVTEEELFSLAWNRSGSLRAALSDRQPEIAIRLESIARDAQQLTPFAFYAKLLGADQARKRFLARLGPEANDVIDEFLNLALVYESREAHSLQGFVAWIRTASAEIKRDMEIARDEVRVMTVHGAKGLEAPIVILADTTTEPQGPIHHQPRLLRLPAPQAAPGTPDRLVWMPSKRDDIGPISAARMAAATDAIDEYRRLLYVAMTRAADRLVVCGALGQIRPPSDCWYELIVRALEQHSVEEPAEVGDGTVLRYRKTLSGPEKLAHDGAAAAHPPAFECPAWLSRDAPPAGAAHPPLSPSQLYDQAAPAVRSTDAGRRQALARGNVMHRLLQSIPGIAPEHRAQAIHRYLAVKQRNFTPAECDELMRKTLSVIENPDFAELFAAGSLAEVPIVGHIIHNGRRHAVTGVMDRLVVTANTILIADHKTNRNPPRTLAAVPVGYLAQLALYRAILTQLYPDKPLRAALVWTEVPDLMEVSAESMDAALRAVTSS